MNRVLIVDDDEALRKALRKALELDGFRVEEAANVDDAVARISATEFNLAILDHDLGESEKTGVSLLLHFRESKLRTPVLFMSGSGADRLEKIAREMGAQVFLAKPFGIRDFLTSCRRLLSGRWEGGP
jgi:DNA-binding response OmpR family regulator